MRRHLLVCLECGKVKYGEFGEEKCHNRKMELLKTKRGDPISCPKDQ